MSSKVSEHYLVIGLAAAIVAALVLLPSVSSEAVYPLERAGQTLVSKLKTRVMGCIRGASASAENLRLKREIESFAVLRGDIERLEAENARLRAVLGYADSKHGEWLPAAVLSRGGCAAAVKRILRVNKGSCDGIVKDAVVIVPDGLVGLVTGVSPHTSEVTLITDSSIKVDCEIEIAGSASARGVLWGGEDELLQLRHLRKPSVIPPQSRVFTSGRGGLFPRGIDIGTFRGVRENVGNLLPEGEVTPTVDYQLLEDVFIRRAK